MAHINMKRALKVRRSETDTDWVRVGHNRYMRMSEGMVECKLHYTTVFGYNPTTGVLIANCGNWSSVTTVRAISDFMGACGMQGSAGFRKSEFGIRILLGSGYRDIVNPDANYIKLNALTEEIFEGRDDGDDSVGCREAARQRLADIEGCPVRLVRLVQDKSLPREIKVRQIKVRQIKPATRDNSDEVLLFATNDEPLYRRMQKNARLDAKNGFGKYRWLRLASDCIQAYRDQIGNPGPTSKMYIAEDLVRYMDEEFKAYVTGFCDGAENARDDR